MWVEQAVYTSTRTRQGRGYHVVAKSNGVTSDVVTALNRWSPSHASLQSNDPNAVSLNFHLLVGDQFAVSRTVYGGKEYSDRGGLQVATMVIVVKRKQLQGYEFNPFRLIRVARSRGCLRWQPRFPERLEPVELPDQEVAESLTDEHEQDFALESVLTHLKKKHRVVVIGPQRPAQLTEAVAKRLPEGERSAFSFTTGLKWSEQRPFSFHAMSEIDTRTRLRLHKANISVVESPLDSVR